MIAEFYQAALAAALLLAAYLYWKNDRLRERIRDLEKGNGPAVSPAVSEFRAENKEISQPRQRIEPSPEPDEPPVPEKEYNYVDPDMGKAPIVPAGTMLGREESVHGDAVYGRENGYDRDAYIGRVSHGAELELLDRRVYKNEFEIDIIKVKVLKNEWQDEIGRVCWLGLDDTSFRSAFNPKTRMIEG